MGFPDNGFLSLMWVGVMIWVCVGVLWFVPMIFAVIVFGIGVALMIMGHQQWGIVGSILALITSFCNFNVMGVMMDVLNLALMIGSIVVRKQDDEAAAGAAL